MKELSVRVSHEVMKTLSKIHFAGNPRLKTGWKRDWDSEDPLRFRLYQVFDQVGF